MTDARMSLTRPLAEAWQWMVGMLFRPFDLGKWLVIGFAAWLAGLLEGGKNFGFNWDSDNGPGQLVHMARGGWDRLMSQEAMAGMIVAGALTLVALLILALWVSSRAKFVFLDNVVRNQAAIVEPWHRFKRAGHSLFLFRLIVGLLCVPLALGVVGLCAWLAFGPDGWLHLEGPAALAGIVGSVLLAFVVLVTGLYVVFFLDAFVVPLMYRYELGVMDAWRRFGALFRANQGWFLLSGLFVCALFLLLGAAITVLGLMTCCLGFLLLALPYLGTVILLPLVITYRAFTVNFLAQLEPELALTAAARAPAGSNV
jgi:hypothetical protein